jgi:N-acetylmuramoyl-L-alanine amidase
MPTVQEFAIASALNGCSTGGLRKLDDQIVEILLAAVNTATETNLVRCDDIPLLRVAGNSTIPLLQPAARKSLKRVIEQTNKPLNLIHAYRTIAQQFVLLQWKINGKCRITAARRPGTSDHERAIAIDIDSDQLSTFKQTLENNQWHWAGTGDPGHFSFVGNGISPKVITESVRSFQILWNRNHPEDLIDEDGVFGDVQTGPRLLRAPVEGFEIV